MDSGNDAKKEENRIDKAQPLLITSGRPESWSAFKLGDGKDDEVPSHFEALINSTIMDRWKLLESKGIDISDYPLECDLLCCVALVIALEEGFRLDECHMTPGFDIRVLRALKRMPPFRVAHKTYRINLLLPTVLDLQFTILIVPVVGDCSIINFMAVGKTSVNRKVEVVSHSTSAIHVPEYIHVINQGCAKFYNVKPLSLVIRPIFDNVKKRVLSDHDIIVPASFSGLPEEVKKHLLKYLGTKDFLSVTATNSSLHNLFSHDEELWKYYLKRDMKIGEIVGVNPLQAYKAWFRRSPPDGRRSHLTAQQATSSRPVRSISELSSTSTPTTASQRSQPRCTMDCGTTRCGCRRAAMNCSTICLHSLANCLNGSPIFDEDEDGQEPLTTVLDNEDEEDAGDEDKDDEEKEITSGPSRPKK